MKTKQAVEIGVLGVLVVALVLALTVFRPRWGPVPVPEFAAAAQGTAAGGQARYAKIALNEDASKVLLVGFDQSQGPGTPYDIVRADRNLNGRLEGSAEAFRGDLKGMEAYRYCFFPTIRLGVPFNEKGKGAYVPCSVRLTYNKSGSEEEFGVDYSIRLREGEMEAGYMFRGQLKTAASLRGAPLWRASMPPTIEITAKPDPDKRKKGNTGIALDLKAGEATLEFVEFEGRQNPNATATIVATDASGKEVHRSTAQLDKFAFG